MPINQFTMGRYELYNTAINRSNILEGANFIWGIGNGNVLPLLEGARLHNDVLKIFIENGLVVFVLFFVILYQKNGILLGVLFLFKMFCFLQIIP